MNTPERNRKNAEKLQKLGKILSDCNEDKPREHNHALENATREYPLPTVRKFAWVFCGGFWLFCLVGLLFSVDIRPLMPFLFFSLGAVSTVHLPVFFLQRKVFDLIVGVIFTLCCLGLAVSMLVR
jgi:hypothetical protein